MKRFLFIVILILLTVMAAVTGRLAYRMIYAAGFMNKETVYLYVDDNKDFDNLCRSLLETAKPLDMELFRITAGILKYPSNMKTGRYALMPGTSCWELLNTLRRGQQAAVRVTFNNVRFIDDLAERLGGQLMFDKGDILRLLNDPACCDSLGFTTETVGALFIPNTYEVYWNIPAEQFIQRMKREYDAFWTNERRAKAAAIPLTPVETAILASIVEEETAAADEFPLVAGLYINRLHRGIRLQADPTVRFAVGDFSVNRILFEHLEVESPYNTYKYAGLPPGIIRIPSVKGIDGVLNYAKHHYIYMCAKEDFSGRHNFAVTLSEHNRNANRYRTELNRRNIRR
ncbi:MAG: endolytic transglycosylase MltG [Tannerellaceae bacterium]|jgi:UPF0755 protein|nr:endolytic transglycosylase MltG [Tannerellaceae bacterium]